MTLSKRFRALARITGFFAAAWAAIGALIGGWAGPRVTGDTAISAAITFALMYGAAGAIAGAATALLAARAETGRQLSDIPTWRLAAWGIVGGMAPAVLFGGLGMIAGAPVSAVLPLLGLGVVGGGLGGLISGSASAAAKTARLSEGNKPPQLPTT